MASRDSPTGEGQPSRLSPKTTRPPLAPLATSASGPSRSTPSQLAGGSSPFELLQAGSATTSKKPSPLASRAASKSRPSSRASNHSNANSDRGKRRATSPRAYGTPPETEEPAEQLARAGNKQSPRSDREGRLQQAIESGQVSRRQSEQGSQALQKAVIAGLLRDA